MAQVEPRDAIPPGVFDKAGVAAMRANRLNPGHVDALPPDDLRRLLDNVWLTPQLRAAVKAACASILRIAAEEWSALPVEVRADVWLQHRADQIVAGESR